MNVRPSFGAATLSLLALALPDAQAREPLRTCAAIRDLPREIADQSLPVVVEGTFVHSFVTGQDSFILQDETDGIFVVFEPEGTEPDNGILQFLTPGDLISVRGVTGPGGFAPVLLTSEISRLAKGELPTPIRPSYHQFKSGLFDARYMEIDGVVQRVSEINPGIREVGMRVATKEGDFSVFFRGAQKENYQSLVDSRVRFRGVGGVFFNPRGEASGPRLTITSDENIEVLESGPNDPFDVPETSALALVPFSREAPILHRRKLTGTVLLCRPGEFTYLEGTERCFRVYSADPSRYEVGTRLEASGFVQMQEDFGVLSDAVFRRVGQDIPPEPLPLTRDEILSVNYSAWWKVRTEDYDGLLVSIEGEMLRFEKTPGSPHLLFFESGGAVMTASMEESLPTESLATITPGTIVDLTGICVVDLDIGWPAASTPRPEGFSLLLRSENDVAVIEPAPWWTPDRLSLALKFAIFASGFLLLLLLLMRREISRQTQLVKNKIERESVLEERQRIARELHDTVQQELTGIGLLLDNVKRRWEKDSGQSRNSLDIARRMVDRCKKDSRNSIEDLYSDALLQRPVEETLREQLQPLVELHGAKLEMEIGEGIEKHLPPRFKTNLIRIAHEAGANAGKHAGAEVVHVRIIRKGNNIELTVEDDGEGFLLEEGQTGTRLGLRSMTQRAERLRGKLSIDSRPGSGTRVSAILPLYNEH